MSYYNWNNALGNHFFGDSQPGQRILMYLDQSIVNKIGEAHGLGDWDSFLLALKQGPVGTRFPHYVQDLLPMLDEDAYSYPNHLVLLACMVLAWTERPQDEHGYYAALGQFARENLDCDHDLKGIAQQLVETFPLVQEWSRRNPKVAGEFTADSLQKHRYVGPIKYHALIQPEDRSNLHFIWQDRGVPPKTEPSQEWLVGVSLRHRQARKWIPGIEKLLRHPDHSIRQDVADWLELEFKQWDGEAPEFPMLPEQAAQPFLELKLVYGQNRDWGIRLYSPFHSGPVLLTWEGKELYGDIQEDGWSDWLEEGKSRKLFRPSLPELIESLLFQLQLPMSEPVELELPTYLVPADTLGAIGTAYIAAEKPTSERPLFLLSPSNEIPQWEDWASNRKVEGWKQISSFSDGAWVLFKASNLPVRERSEPQGSPQAQVPVPVQPKKPTPSLRTADLKDPWQFPTGVAGAFASHFDILGNAPALKGVQNWRLTREGLSKPIPRDLDILHSLLKSGSFELPYAKYYACIRQQAVNLDLIELERIEERRLLKRTAALGFFMTKPSRQRLQLAPPSLIYLPNNGRDIRALMVGIWTHELAQQVVDWCQEPSHGLHLDWIVQASPLIPSLGILTGFHEAVFDRLVEALESKQPGTLQPPNPIPYSLALLSFLRPPQTPGWLDNAEAICKRVFVPSTEHLDPHTCTFKPVPEYPHFPLLTRDFHDRFGYPMYTYWYSEQEGVTCDGAWATWRLLEAHNRPALFEDSTDSSTILLPCIPMPSLLERALVLASGQLRSTALYTLPNGKPIRLRPFPGIRYPLKKLLPRILFGLPESSAPLNLYHSTTPYPAP